MTFKTKNIGIDIDSKREGKKLLRILRILNIKGKYRISSSKRGFHFNLDVKRCTKEEQLLIRYIFGDCYGRWLGDVRRLKFGIETFNVLFDKKKGRKSGRWKKI